jgi:hypothetical protein
MMKNEKFRRLGILEKSKVMDKMGLIKRTSTEEKKFKDNQRFICVDKNKVFEDAGYEPNIYFDVEKYEFISNDAELVREYESKLAIISEKYLEYSNWYLIDKFGTKKV